MLFRPTVLGLAASLAIQLGTVIASAAEPPEARRGFQASHHFGLSFPAGKATGEPGDRLGSRYNFQWHFFLVSLGAKITNSVYLGGYADAALGAKGRDARVRQACEENDGNLENDIGCSASTLRFGLETRYHFLPEKLTDVWVGYGFGPVLATQTINDRVIGRSESTHASGWEYARLSVGVTMRPAKALGMGPFVTTAIGQFNSTRTEINDETMFEGKIEGRALHVWTSAGLRLVLFP